MTVQEVINRLSDTLLLMNIKDVALWFGMGVVLFLSIYLMFAWENKVRWWLRLPIINLFLFALLIIGGICEEIYLTFHPKKRTKYIKTTIFQIFF